MIVDTIALYKIVTKIVAPFTKWDAFRAGVIDAEGNILVPPQKRTYQQASTMTAFDVLCLNLKRALAKIPGGSSPLGLSAAFLYYLVAYIKHVVNTIIGTKVENTYRTNDIAWQRDVFVCNVCGGNKMWVIDLIDTIEMIVPIKFKRLINAVFCLVVTDIDFENRLA